MECDAELNSNQLEIKLKLYNQLEPEFKEYNYDDNESIYIPISEWVIKGNTESAYVTNWDWFYTQLINYIVYIPKQFDSINEEKLVVDFDNEYFNIDYLPELRELKSQDSLIFHLSYTLSDRNTKINDSLKLFIQIPFIKSRYLWEISTYSDIINNSYYTDKDYNESEFTKYISDLYEFNSQDVININIHQNESKSIVGRNYNNFTNIKIDEAIRRMIRISIFNNTLDCNCNIKSKY